MKVVKRRSRDCERMLVLLEMLRGRHDHPDANLCLAEMRRLIPGIGQSTVYRHLAYLVDKGLVTEIKTDSGPAKYDADLESHGHFQCLKCSKIWDVSPIKIQADYPGLPETIFHLAKGTCRQCLKINA
ncbi:MAG: transcriptional repressor [Patescibacteria group bacterium]|jgi:Fur family peroxide stress response transcriptional regulator|nr:transcriptional repressor [Patescibacteria group bacterium]